MKPAPTIADIDEALAKLALLIRAQGPAGARFLPFFERLEQERERMASVDDRLDRALARVGRTVYDAPGRQIAPAREAAA